MHSQLLTLAAAGTPAWATASIGAGGLLLGVLATVAGNAYVARTKIREAEILYRQKLSDAYLATARSYTQEIYLPLTIALSRLADRYLEFRDAADLSTTTAPASSQQAFNDAIATFARTIAELAARGADAFLTTELETRLREFTHYLTACIDADTETRKLIVRMLGGFWSRQSGGPLFQAQTTHSFWPRLVEPASIIMGALPIAFGVQFRFKADVEIVSAPIASQAFAERFDRDLLLLKSAIKLVTLGTKDP